MSTFMACSQRSAQMEVYTCKCYIKEEKGLKLKTNFTTKRTRTRKTN